MLGIGRRLNFEKLIQFLLSKLHTLNIAPIYFFKRRKNWRSAKPIISTILSLQVVAVFLSRKI